MTKIILNGCYGGYGWSMKGVYAVLQKKNKKNLRFVAEAYPNPGNRVELEVSESQWLKMAESISQHNNKCGPNGMYISDVHIVDEDGKKWFWLSIDREDPDAIEVLERLGSEYCSSDYAKLYIEEYDENLFVADIDEYDGVESLELKPNLTEERIRACSSIDEVVKLLKETRAI